MMSDGQMSAKLRVSLLLLRIGVAAVMLPWAIDKMINPDHTASVFSRFYMVSDLSVSVSFLIGAVQLLIVLAFLAGIARTWTYGAVLVMHTVSTLSSYSQYLHPFQGGNLLFFAAWPMLAACVVLFLFRDEDRMLTISARGNSGKGLQTQTL